MPSDCRFCDRPAVRTWSVEGLTERGEPDTRHFDACKDHAALVRGSRWDELIASADDKAAAMDLAQLANRGGVRISDEPKIGIESEGLEAPGYRSPRRWRWEVNPERDVDRGMDL